MIAVFVDRLTFDQFHHKVGHAFPGRTAVVQTRDVGMIEAGENLPLILKARDDKRGALLGVYEFDRYLTLILIIGPYAAVHRAHSAFSNHGDDLVGTQDLANATIRFFGQVPVHSP